MKMLWTCALVAALCAAAPGGSRLRARTDGSRFLNDNTKKFVVDGKSLPDISFDLGESYAGQLPISNKTDEKSKLYFWFFPTANEEHKEDKEVVIWLNGGPGCSSLLGFLQENGPAMWSAGRATPVQNPWSWHQLTNVVWVEQPVSVGFSEGEVTARDENEVAEQFLGFWRNLVDAFGLHDHKVFVAAESYGGFYGPYIASHMLDAADRRFFDLSGLIVYDGVMFDQKVQFDVPAARFAEQHYELMPLGDTARDQVQEVARRCGYDDFIDKHLVFPPAGPAPALAPGSRQEANGSIVAEPGCRVNEQMGLVISRASRQNPCFDVYRIQHQCPVASNVLPVDRPAEKQEPYFNREDVKKAINAPLGVNWTACVSSSVFATPDGQDGSQGHPSSDHELPNVIDKTQNVIIAQGNMDYIIPLNGILLGIQNMTWGGKLGFESAPTDPFFVPNFGVNLSQAELESGFSQAVPVGWGVQGTTHTERGLTLVVSASSGHMGPADSPAGAFRHLEKLLGRAKSLSDKEPFTLPQLRDVRQPEEPLGKGTVTIPCAKRGC
ncbi:hypothetical protein CDD83_4249 [Cordyceps sp. RAO-2017]|nr:hypothetical protein CDD83_4249 [Cordyceps sp. RAO-2017]